MYFFKIKDFIISKVWYDKDSQSIFTDTTETETQIVVDVRGWARISNLHTKNGKFFDDRAYKFQDELGEWLAKAINEKLDREDTIMI